MRRRLAAVIVAAALAAGGALAAVTPAHAVGGNTGMCDSGANSAYCWRQVSGGGTYLWQRDISGDLNQHYFPIYIGNTAQWNCGTAYGMPGNVGVWTFSDSSGILIGAGYYGYVGEDPNGPSDYDRWAWAAGGALINCGQSNYWHALDPLCGYYNGLLGHQLVVNGNCGEPWTSVDPPARRGR